LPSIEPITSQPVGPSESSGSSGRYVYSTAPNNSTRVQYVKAGNDRQYNGTESVSGVQLVVNKTNIAPYVEKSFEIKLKGGDVNLRPLNNLDQNYQALGDLIGSSKLTMLGPEGAVVEYDVSVKLSGLEIKPLNSDSTHFIDVNRTAVIGAAILEATGVNKISADMIKTIFLDLTNR
jgi:hypothetical protein